MTNRLFITGIPASGKTYLADKIAYAVGGIAVHLDDLREGLANDSRYNKWVNFYLDQNENEYLMNTSPDQQWQNLVNQSEALWPAFLLEINKYKNEKRPVIFECVNILPHIANKELNFPGLVLIGESMKAILERNKKDPRWGCTEVLQELEAKTFFEVERPRYLDEASKFNIPVFEKADDAFGFALTLLHGPK